MKNKKLLSTIVGILFLTLGLSAATVTGKIIDNNTNEDVAYASIALILQGQQEALVGTISDDTGQFILLKVPNGIYTAVISFIGYETKEIPNITITGKNKTIDLGKISVNTDAVGLETLEVSATVKTSVKKIDRQTYNADDFETAKGGTAIDILDKLPSISVDGEGTVSMRGTSNFMVYLNGKPTNTEASILLSQLPADNIKDIDVITVPTSKYDAQGKGGIINITTKRSNIDGLSIVTNGMLGGTPWKNTNDIYSNQKLNNNRYNAGLNLMYGKDKFTVNAAFNAQSRHNNGVGIIDPYIYQQPGKVNNEKDGMYYVLDGEGSRPKWYNNMMFSAGVNYALNEKSDFAASYQYSKRESGRTANYNYDAYFSHTPEGAPVGAVQKIYNPNDIHRDGWFSSSSLDYNLELNEKSHIAASFTYEASNLEQTIENKEYSYDSERYYLDDDPDFHSFQSDETPLNAYRFSINYTTEFEDGSQLDLGIQPQWVRLDGIFRYDTIVGNNYWGDADSYDNDIDMKRDVYATYIDYSGSKGKLNYILGLRMEYLDQEMTVQNTEYFDYVYGYFSEIGEGRDYDQKDFNQNKLDFFPTLHLGYQVNELNNLSLAASRRINRPPAKDMAPFLYRRHQEIYEMGDPLLEPEYIVTAELNYTRHFGKNNILLTGFYRGVDNAIYRVNRVAYDMGNPGGVLLRSYTNAGNQTAVGGEIGINLDLLDRVKLYIGGALYDFRVNADDELLGESRDSRSTNWNMKSNMAWLIAKPLKLTLDYSINSGTVTPQGENLKFQALNAAVNYTPEKLKGWTFTAKALDILGTNQAGGYTTAYDGNQILLRRDYVYDYEGQIIEIGASYRFNQKKQKEQKKHIGDDYF